MEKLPKQSINHVLFHDQQINTSPCACHNGKGKRLVCAHAHLLTCSPIERANKSNECNAFYATNEKEGRLLPTATTLVRRHGRETVKQQILRGEE